MPKKKLENCSCIPVKIKLDLNKDEFKHLLELMKEFSRVTNAILNDHIQGKVNLRGKKCNGDQFTSKNVREYTDKLAGIIRTAACQEALTLLKKYEDECKRVEKINLRMMEKYPDKPLKEAKIPELKRPMMRVPKINLHYDVDEQKIAFRCDERIDGRCAFRLVLPEDLLKQLNKAVDYGSALFSLGRNNTIYMDIPCYFQDEVLPEQEKPIIMGIDVGLKVPAVSWCSDGSAKFYGNGRENKAMRRYFDSKRKELGKGKHLNAIRTINSKEQRIAKDRDHLVSKRIIDTALEHNVSVIRMENLSGIRNSWADEKQEERVKEEQQHKRKYSKKARHSLSTWGYYRLQQYIEYKAKRAGIRVEYVNPAFTSKKCPACAEAGRTIMGEQILGIVKDRDFHCPECGYHAHRDLVGARNICLSEPIEKKKSKKR